MNGSAQIAIGGVSVALLLSAANGEPVITVEQRDGMRAAKAPRMADVSADGRFVVFQSWSRLVAADADSLLDVYVLDRLTGRVTLESGDVDPTAENAHPRISGDGRLVVFESRATRLDQMPRMDIVLRDRELASTQILTSGAHRGGVYTWSRSPDISDDGRRVVFSSASTSLVADADMNGEFEDVYAIELASGRTIRVNLNTAGAQLAEGNSILPSVSADGHAIAFASTSALDQSPLRGSLPAQGSGPRAQAAFAELLAAPRSRGTTPTRQIYVRDLDARTTVRVSRTARGGLPDADCSLPSISGDGRYIVYTSEATNLAAHDTNRSSDVYLVDRETGVTTQVSRAADGSSANGTSLNAVISADGRAVAFQSDAGNLVCASRCAAALEDLNLLWDVFIWDRSTGRIVRASEDELGGWMDWSAGPAIDGSGRIVAFSSRHPIDAADQQQDLDLFVRTRPPVPSLTTARK
jgi:Tol biopolymer transport system component